MKEKLAQLWDQLPQDTLIASLLDPRFKFLTSFPETEKEEAWKLLEAEYNIEKQAMSATLTATTLSAESITTLPKIITTNTPTTKTTTSKRKRQDEIAALMAKRRKIEEPKKGELEQWRQLDEVEFSVDVLLWWKLNEVKFPVLALLAKKFLAVPASQADTERSFSTGRRIVTWERCSTNPHHVEKLVVWHQSSALFTIEE